MHSNAEAMYCLYCYNLTVVQHMTLVSPDSAGNNSQLPDFLVSFLLITARGSNLGLTN